MDPQVYITTQNNAAGVTLNIVNNIQSLADTYLQSDTVIGATSFLTENTRAFTANDIVILSRVGSENAELLTVTSVTNNETIVLSTATQNHNRGEILQRILWNQIVIETSANGTSWSTLATISIDPTRQQTSYLHAAGTSATYYRVSFKNSVTATTSNTSTAQQATQTYQASSVGSFLTNIKNLVGISDNDYQVTDSFLIGALGTARQLVDSWLFGYAFEWRQQFEYPVQLFAGRNYVDLPSNIDFSKTDRSILAFRMPVNFSTPQIPLQQVDKRAWNDACLGANYSAIAIEALSGATSLTFEQTSNFPESGTIRIACNAVGDTILEVAYTANNEATATLTGVSGVTRTLTVGTQGFISSAYGYPYQFTVFENKLWFTNPLPQEINGKYALMDYYKQLVPITSLADIFEEKYFSIYESYLRYAIKKRRDDTITLEDADYLTFKNQVDTLGISNYTGQMGRIRTS